MVWMDSGLLSSPAQAGGGARTAFGKKCPFGAPWRQSSELSEETSLGGRWPYTQDIQAREGPSGNLV